MMTNAASVPPMKRIVPWKYREEWLDIYFSAFSNCSEKQKFALEKILSWKIRTCENISLAIELTWQLLSIKLKYVENKEIPFLQDDDIKELYGIYIIRFVNYTLEAFQNGKNLIPLKHLAEKVGLPKWILDLRHSLTYGKLPELVILTDAVDYALKYLEENYWKPQAQYTVLDESECQKKFKSLLDEHFSLINELKNKQKLSEYKINLQELELYVQANCKVFLRVICESEFLNFPSSQGGGILQVPKNVSESWKRLFHQLNCWNLSQAFLEGLLGRLSEEGSELDRCIFAWTCFVCKEEIVKNEKAENLNFDANKILFLSMQRPNKFTPHFVDKYCGIFPELFKHRMEMLSLLTACGIDHPWQNHQLEFSTLEERAQQNAKDNVEHRDALEGGGSSKNSCIVNIEKKEWDKVLRCITSFERTVCLNSNPGKRKRQGTDYCEVEPPKKQVSHPWEFRCFDGIPTAATELTSKLVSLKQLDAKNEEIRFLTDFQMRSLYGFHIIRFVEKTLYCYKSRKSPGSLEDVARKAGLPMWLVDLRHEAAHQSPPELFVLRDAVDLALKFIKMDYWIPMTLYMIPKRSGDQESSGEILTLMRHAAKYKNKSTASENSESEELEHHAQAHCDELIETLLSNESLLSMSPCKDQMETLNLDEADIKEWSPVFDRFIEWNLIEGLMECMLRKLTTVGTERDRSILAWICFICNRENQKKYKIASRRSFDSRRILHRGTATPNKFTPFFVDKICGCFDELSKHRSNLLCTLNAHGFSHPWKDCNFELDDLMECEDDKNASFERSLLGQTNEDPKDSQLQTTMAKLIAEKDGTEWLDYPIGVNPLGYFGSIHKSTWCDHNKSMEFIEGQYNP